MDSPCLYVTVLLLNIFEFSSGIDYNKGDMVKHFACSSEGFPKENEMIKLYLTSKNLKIQCFFLAENDIASKYAISVFTSGGLAPSLAIINSTYNGIFHFNLTLFSDQVFWVIDIPRENITRKTDAAAVEEWLVRITLHHGLNIYATEGTLLDYVREPILQWNIGNSMSQNHISSISPHVIDLKVAKCPCANDVALLGFILNTTLNGVYLGLSFSGFWHYNDTKWYDMTDTIYAKLREDHAGLSLVDMVLTNHVLVLLTSLGLFVSEDLRYPTGQKLQLSREDFCGFERVDYLKGKLWYNERCFANRERFEVDYVTVTFDRNRTLSESSACFYSKEPFLKWQPCLLPHVFKRVRNPALHVVTFLVDQEQNTGVYLYKNWASKYAAVSVNILNSSQPNSQPRFPVFVFPSSFTSPVGMVFHPRSHFLYVYGNQVWLSVDGGNTFDLIDDFHGDIIKTTYHSFYTSDIVFVSTSGKAYLTKAGLRKYSEIGRVADKIFTLYYDHLGFIHKLSPDHFAAGGSVHTSKNSENIFGQPPDMGFETALAPQYISLNEMLFFAYVPPNEPEETKHTKKFKNIHLGKLIHSSKTGTAYIRKVLYHDAPKGFLSSIITELREPFGIEEVNESSCLSSSLSVSEYGDFYKLTLDSQIVNASFQDTDIEKTVVIPGHSSFLITAILDAKNAVAVATMPKQALNLTLLLKDSWVLYNFGQRNGRAWNISSKPCNHWFQQPDDSLSLNTVKYIDLGNSQNLKVKIKPTSKDFQTLEAPLLDVFIGDPTLLDVKINGLFDETDSYVAEISVASKTLRQGSTSLALVSWESSTECFVTTIVPTLKSSCSYLRTMHHIPSRAIPMQDWIRGVHKDSQGFNMIKTLPINYRPPSNMGIAIPLTDNFYHADPSQPIPRNLFRKSKEAGKYKQCANVSTREECNCTNAHKFSHSVAFSDCREKVPRFKFPVVQYPITLKISNESVLIPVKSPYLVTVTEVNLRKNWQLSFRKKASLANYFLCSTLNDSIVKHDCHLIESHFRTAKKIMGWSYCLKQKTCAEHSVPGNIKKLKNYLEPLVQAPVYNPSGLNISIKGSELFHFRVSVVPGVTFCDLVEEFQIYVDDAPLPFPGHTLIAVAAAVVLGGLIFTAFMFQLRDIHPWTSFWKWVLRKRRNISSISVSQQARK